MATLSDLYAHLKTLCEQWFYNKSTMDTYLANKANSSHTHGNITNDGKVGAAAAKPLITGTGGVVQAGSFGTTAGTFCQGNDSRLSNARTPTAHNQGSNTITEASALSNIGTSANATQHTINEAINTVIGSLSSIDAVQVVSTLPTASADTMGGLYIINENSKVNVYYTEESSGAYSWHKMDTDILDELSIAWTDITDKPSTFTPSSHTHGNITNDGKILTTVASIDSNDFLLIVDTSDSSIVKRTSHILSTHMKHGSALANIGTSSNATQSAINSNIDTALGTINTSLTNKASSTHTHNNITNDGKVTVTGTNGGNLVVTNSSDEVIVESAIDVLDGVVQSLISYGNS